MKAARHIPVGWRQLRHNRLRLVAALAGITFAAILMLVQLGFRSALFESGIRWHNAWDYDIALLSPKSEYLLEVHDIPRIRVFQAGGVEGVRAVTPVYTKMGKWRNPENPKQVWPIFVAAFDPADEGFGKIISPQQQARLRLDDYYLFDYLSRPEYGPIPAMLGTRDKLMLEMNGRRIRIGGLFEVGNSFGINGALITSDLNYLRMFPNRSHAQVSIGLVQIEPGTVAEEVRDAITAALPPDVVVVTREEFKALEIAYWDSSTPIGYVLNLGVVMGLVVGAIIVYQILFSDVQDHLKEYATLKAMGYTNRYLSGVVLQEAAILAVAGFVPAILLSLGVFRVSAAATNLPLQLTLDKIAIVLGLTLVMCAIAGLLAMRKVRSADPADVFWMAGARPIQVENVSYYYGAGSLRKQILFDVSTEIDAGEIVILTGPSGSGKTTLLTLIGALRSCQEGVVRVLDNNLSSASENELVKVRRRIGYIFQQHNLLESLSVAQNIQMALELSGERSRKDWNERIEQVLEQVGMAEHMFKMPDQLSGGQKQRIGIARALVHHPAIILADEPTASLDKHSGRDVVELIQRLAREEGAAVVLVTHDNRILDIADRILHLEDGRIKNLMDAVGDDAGRLLNLMARFDPNAYSELAAFALALTRVASADQRIDEEENIAIRRILLEVSHLSEGEAELVMQLSHSMLGMHGIGPQAQAAEDGESQRRRQDWLEALHAVAAADGEVSADELAEIERIAAELGLT